MRISLILIVVIAWFSCKRENKRIPEFNDVEKIIPIDSIVYDNDNGFGEKYKLLNNNSERINLNESPISIKSLVLDDRRFWVTSSMIDSIYQKNKFCRYKDYHLVRGYNVINKELDSTIIVLDTYVVDNDSKWSREDAYEELKEVTLNDPTIKVWNMIYVGMKVVELLELIKQEEYHEDFGVFKVYSKVFESSFFFKKNLIDSIQIKRICNN